MLGSADQPQPEGAATVRLSTILAEGLVYATAVLLTVLALT